MVAKTKVASATPEPIDHHEAQEYKIIEKIKKANECNTHPGHVHVVVSGGEHISPTHEDLAIWAHLVVRESDVFIFPYSLTVISVYESRYH